MLTSVKTLAPSPRKCSPRSLRKLGWRNEDVARHPRHRSAARKLRDWILRVFLEALQAGIQGKSARDSHCDWADLSFRG